MRARHPALVWLLLLAVVVVPAVQLAVSTGAAAQPLDLKHHLESARSCRNGLIPAGARAAVPVLVAVATVPAEEPAGPAPAFADEPFVPPRA